MHARNTGKTPDRQMMRSNQPAKKIGNFADTIYRPIGERQNGKECVHTYRHVVTNFDKFCRCCERVPKPRQICQGQANFCVNSGLFFGWWWQNLVVSGSGVGSHLFADSNSDVLITTATKYKYTKFGFILIFGDSYDLVACECM